MNTPPLSSTNVSDYISSRVSSVTLLSQSLPPLDANGHV